MNLDGDLGIDDTWVVGVRVARTVTARWTVEAEIVTGPSTDRAGVSGRVWQFNAHALYHSTPMEV